MLIKYLKNATNSLPNKVESLHILKANIIAMNTSGIKKVLTLNSMNGFSINTAVTLYFPLPYCMASAYII